MGMSNKKRLVIIPFAVVVVFLLPSCAKKHVREHIEKRGYEEEGLASWYGPRFHGRRTANGEKFNRNALTAAHRTLPFGTKVLVTNPENEKFVVVRINDRGPHRKNRIIDLSQAAAREIGLLRSGVARVEVVEVFENDSNENESDKRGIN